MDRDHSLSATSMSRHNRDVILRVLRAEGPLPRSELVERIGASPATVNRLTTSLLERGLIVSVGTATTGRGRPSMVVRFNEQAAYVAAVDIGSQVTRSALVDLTGGVTALVEEPVPDGAGPRQRLDQVRDVALGLLASARARRRAVIAVGVGVPGVVTPDGVVDWAPVLGWRQVGLARVLRTACDLPVVAENDANALAIAEHRHGAARGTAAMVALNLGNGIGAGVIAGGALYRGHTAAAGEIGYMLLGTSSLRQTYAGFGDIESRVGAEGIARRSRELGLADEVAGPLTAASVFEMARRGHPVATGLVDEICDELALALANVAAVLDPGAVVLGGGIGGSADLLIPRLEERLSGRIPHVPRLLGPSHGHGVLVGVAELAIDAVGSLDGALAEAGSLPAQD
ncbi:ROK family transcriptional regulator [Actinotalea fermentans]|nr:ROK family transcriptional regulator [Actinotalea fermentans]KGM16182.1 hypothetical protein N867_02300 [Actinotalea fermentans ATCC 43279 = JCM 9966 = DSM 3133]